MTDSPAPRSAGLPLAAILLVALAAGFGLWAGQRWFAPAAVVPKRLANTILYPQPKLLPAFRLDGSEGKSLDAAALRGRWTLLFLGFTRCPDICPTTLALLADAEKSWSDLPEARRPRILFVSADPERDTPQKTAEYARYFSPTALGATADHTRLEPFLSSLGMVYMKIPTQGDEYTIDHSNSIAVLDPDVRLVGLIRPPLDSTRIAADLRALTGN